MRTCPSCNYSISKETFKGSRCGKCDAEFLEQYCNSCQKWQPSDMYYTHKSYTGRVTRRKECKPCGWARKKKHDQKNPKQRYDRDRRFIEKREKEVNERYAAWKARINELPRTVMKEQQWLDVCSFFGGCVTCGSEHIETRQYFIHFDDGGKYAPWNIFPMCGACSTRSTRMTTNPFRWFDDTISANRFDPVILNKLIEYFELQIKKVENNV
jgi:hypothetical protein